jgi:hypothetical protein
LNLLSNFTSRMVFLNSNKLHQSLLSKESLKLAFKRFQAFLLFQFWDKTKNSWKISKTVLETSLKSWNHEYFGLWQNLCYFIAVLLNWDIIGASERFIEDYLTNLTSWRKTKNRFGMSEKNRFGMSEKNRFGTHDLN